MNNTPQVAIVVQPVQYPPRTDWPRFPAAGKPSSQSPYKTMLRFGEQGSEHCVRIIVEGRTKASVDAVAAMITRLD